MDVQRAGELAELAKIKGQLTTLRPREGKAHPMYKSVPLTCTAKTRILVEEIHALKTIVEYYYNKKQ